MRIELAGPTGEAHERVLTPDALEFVAALEAEFGPRREELLSARAKRQGRLDAGGTLDFLEETRDVREADWTVPPPPPDLLDRRTEITGPTVAKMVINALNSGATGFMADFEDSNSPTWDNLVSGQANLIDAVAGRLRWDAPDGREYRLGEQTATLIVRPRGWHLVDRHLLVDGRPVSGALQDFGLFFFHNARALVERGSGPYFYLPKMESHLEARLWNDVFLFAQEAVGLPPGAVRATALIETVPAAFEMSKAARVVEAAPGILAEASAASVLAVVAASATASVTTVRAVSKREACPVRAVFPVDSLTSGCVVVAMAPPWPSRRRRSRNGDGRPGEGPGSSVALSPASRPVTSAPRRRDSILVSTPPQSRRRQQEQRTVLADRPR